jgi:hypothetical protein
MYNDSERNGFLTRMIYYGDINNINEPTTDKKRIDVIDAYATIDYYNHHNEYGSEFSVNENNITGIYFNIDSSSAKVLFTCVPEFELFEPISTVFECTISTEILGKKEKFISVSQSPEDKDFSWEFHDMFYTNQTIMYIYKTYHNGSFNPPQSGEWWDEIRIATNAKRNERDAIAREEQERKAKIVDDRKNLLREQFNRAKENALTILIARKEYFEKFIPDNVPKNEVRRLTISPVRNIDINLLRLIEAFEEDERMMRSLDPKEYEIFYVLNEDGTNGEYKINSGYYYQIDYYNETPFDNIVPYSVIWQNGNSDIKQAYDTLSEAAGNYYKTPLSP